MNLTQKLRDRYEIRELAKNDLGFRREVLLRCAEDTLYWFDNFAWTFDPRTQPSEVPFIPYDGKQRDFILFLEDVLKHPKDIFIDKPRDVGATALIMNFLLKHYLFDDSFNARAGSRKEDYVDRAGDPDTLFYKIDYTFDRLPLWMQPKQNRSYLKLTRDDNSNAIVGESANPSFARGGRQTMVLFDEFGFWPWAQAAWESAGDVTNIRIAMTTPPDTGKSSHAYKLLSGQAGNITVFGFDFRDIPHKNDAWLVEQRARRSTEEFEREVLKSYSGTAKSKVYMQDFNAQVKLGTYEYNPSLPLYISWDFGMNDPTSMIWFQKDMKTNNVYVIDSFEKSGNMIDFFVPFVTGEVASGIYEYTDQELEMIARHKEWRKDITHYGDPSGKNRNQVSKDSIISELKKHGIYVQTKPPVEHRIYREKTIMLFRRLHVDEKRNQYFIECIISARYPERSEGSQATTPIDKPIHDHTSHYRTALEFFAYNEPDVERLQRKYKVVKYGYKPNGG